MSTCTCAIRFNFCEVVDLAIKKEVKDLSDHSAGIVGTVGHLDADCLLVTKESITACLASVSSSRLAWR